MLFSVLIVLCLFALYVIQFDCVMYFKLGYMHKNTGLKLPINGNITFSLPQFAIPTIRAPMVNVNMTRFHFTPDIHQIIMLIQ